ncbi:GNAT family N-acetyltransferase [Candidatus Latescibacterota bacterium]
MSALAGGDARTLEERALNAWPALRQSLFDGWILRFSEGYTKRANCVVPFYPGVGGAGDKIARCERTYAQHQLPPIFKILPFCEPRALDDALASRGYVREDETLVQSVALPVSTVETPVSERPTVIHGEAPRSYLEAYARLNGISAIQLPRVSAILAQSAGEVGYAAVMEGGQVVACGLGIVEGDHLGLYGVATDTAHRRRGLGAGLVKDLMVWASQRRARQAYLQVRVSNHAARSLYRKLGFTPAYRYWYRVSAM